MLDFNIRFFIRILYQLVCLSMGRQNNIDYFPLISCKFYRWHKVSISTNNLYHIVSLLIRILENLHRNIHIGLLFFMRFCICFAIRTIRFPRLKMTKNYIDAQILQYSNIVPMILKRLWFPIGICCEKIYFYELFENFT